MTTEDAVCIAKVQEHLRIHGYLDSTVREHVTLESLHGGELGVMDDATIAALTQFQRRQGLRVSGVIDADTLKLVDLPRCGVDDLFELSARGRAWNKHALTYRFREVTPDLSQDQVRWAVREAFELWSRCVPLTFTEIQGDIG